MWESPIKTICDEMRTQFEGEVLKAVQRVGIEVDKDQLIKALNYDRNQYAKGYKDGYDDAKKEIIHCKECRYSHLTYDGKNKHCVHWPNNAFSPTEYLDGGFYCGFAKRREE